jgi:poly[(R)-3-hydroxyalkanoate] polymerase subunit PhaC
LPARLHGDFLDLISSNPFFNPGTLSIAGTPLDMRRVEVDAYVVAGITDHITPWKAVYRTARMLGPDTTFVLSNSGRLQALLNPPGNTQGVIRGRDGEREGPGCVPRPRPKGL